MEMPDILADYREWREQQAIRVSTHSDGCHMWHRDCMIHRLADALAVEQAKRTLTDAEREAIETSFDALQYAADELGLGQGDCDRLAATLRGLLERTQPSSDS
jgi:hypothetical protein